MTSAFMVAEKNKVASGNVTLMLLEIHIPGETETVVRIAQNNEDVTWAGETWQALPVQISEIPQSSKGDVPRVDIQVSNVNREMRYYIELYDIYTKTYGYSPITVKIMVINSGNLAATEPEVEFDFELVQPKSGTQWATFTLGAPSPFNQRYPLLRVMKNHCQVMKFKDAECGYNGAETTCDRTLTTCRTYSNSGRFKAFPGAGNTAIRL